MISALELTGGAPRGATGASWAERLKLSPAVSR